MNAASSIRASEPEVSSEERTRLPRKLGRYTLFEHIGRGGMAEIYLARAETELGATRLAVVKQILPAYADDPRFSEMLIHEAKLAARLSHKHVVQVLHLGRTGGDDDHLFIAMEYVEGFDLNALLRRCSDQKIGLPVEHALGIVLDALEGLDHAHRAGIVHRDVSPSNVLISYEGEVKLCDFGIAHAIDVVKDKESEALKGKAGYMSPEHARGETVDARSDVFAAGIIVWELLAGRRLYKPRSEVPLIEQAQRADIPKVPDKGLPSYEALAAIVGRALSVDRDARYPSARAFARDLETYLAEAGLLASRLELGKWLASSFGTEIVEQRRASERRLPKSVPPPRSSERVRTSSSPTHAIVVPPAPRVPSDVVEKAEPEKPSSSELSLETTPEPSLPLHPLHPVARVSLGPESLEGAAMDVGDSSRKLVDATPAGDSVPPPAPPSLLARPRSSLVVMVALVAIAVLVAIARHLVH